MPNVGEVSNQMVFLAEITRTTEDVYANICNSVLKHVPKRRANRCLPKDNDSVHSYTICHGSQLGLSHVCKSRREE